METTRTIGLEPDILRMAVPVDSIFSVVFIAPQQITISGPQCGFVLPAPTFVFAARWGLQHFCRQCSGKMVSVPDLEKPLENTSWLLFQRWSENSIEIHHKEHCEIDTFAFSVAISLCSLYFYWEGNTVVFTLGWTKEQMAVASTCHIFYKR